MIQFFKKVDWWIQRILRFIAMSMFTVLATLLVANVSLRLINDLTSLLESKGMEGAANLIKSIITINSFHWFDEVVELAFAALVFYGAAALWCSKQHFSVGDWISPRIKSHRIRHLYKIVILLISAVFMGIFFWFALKLTNRTHQVTTVFQIKQWILYSCMPASAIIMLTYSIIDVFVEIRKFVLGLPDTEQVET